MIEINFSYSSKCIEFCVRICFSEKMWTVRFGLSLGRGRFLHPEHRAKRGPVSLRSRQVGVKQLGHSVWVRGRWLVVRMGHNSGLVLRMAVLR
jgi:hypothetical protein